MIRKPKGHLQNELDFEPRKFRGLATLGQRIKYLRQCKGFTQERLAQNIGEPRAVNISTLETGRIRTLTFDRLYKIARQLECSPLNLTGMEELKEWPRHTFWPISPELDALTKRMLKSFYLEGQSTFIERPGEFDPKLYAMLTRTGARVSFLRQRALGTSAKGLSDLSGVSEQEIISAERNHTQLHPQSLPLIARALQVTVGQLKGTEPLLSWPNVDVNEQSAEQEQSETQSDAWKLVQQGYHVLSVTESPSEGEQMARRMLKQALKMMALLPEQETA